MIIALTLLWAVQEPPDDRISDLVLLLSSSDAAVRACAKKELVLAGRAAVPAIEAAMRGRGTLDHYLALLDIYRLHATGEDELRWIGEAIYGAIAEKAPSTGVDRRAYVAARYEDACRLYQEEQYDAAGRIAEGLILLEPDAPEATDVRRLGALCEQRRLQATTVAARVVAEGRGAVKGETIKLKFTLENRSKEEVRLDFGFGSGILVVEFVVTAREPLGTESVATRAASIDLGREVALAPGASKSYALDFDTREDFKDSDFMRTVDVHAWIQPYRLHVGKQSLGTRIIFVPARVAVVPPSSRAALADPYGAFCKAVDKDSMHDVFICAMLLEGPEKEEATGRLIRLLREMDPSGRAMTCYTLTFMTGRQFGSDVTRWEKWWTERRPEKRP